MASREDYEQANCRRAVDPRCCRRDAAGVPGGTQERRPAGRRHARLRRIRPPLDSGPDHQQRDGLSAHHGAGVQRPGRDRRKAGNRSRAGGALGDVQGQSYLHVLPAQGREVHPKEGEEAKPFTADDVVFTYKIMMHPKTTTPLKVRYEFIESVEKLSDYGVQFTLKRPILNALAKFSFKVIPKHGPSHPLYLTREDPFVRQPIGTGPFVVKTITTDRGIVLVANENYFKGRPHINRFISKPFADQNIMTQALMFNAIDMVVLVNPRDIPELQGDKRFVLQPYNALSYAFFGYNLRSPLLADKRVRQAFTYAVNRQEVLDSFFNGQGTLVSGPFAPGSWAYNLDVRPLPFDPQKAVALLRQAGFAPGPDGTLQKDGKKLTLSLKVPIEKESEAVKRVVLAFQNYLKNIGVAIKVEFKEWQAWKESVFQEHDFDIIFASWVFDDSADISY